MKKILITGKNSYIGNALATWLLNTANNHDVVEKISLKDQSWREQDFSSYDTIVHVAGIAHSDISGSSAKTKALYYQINTDLTIAVAKKAQRAGVGQFIFISSMIVYGNSAPFGSAKMVTAHTLPAPANFYGDSKWQAELGLTALSTADFKVAIIRPPMIYGKNSQGNYPRLVKLAKLTPVLPDVENVRSMLYIDNLCEFIRLLIVNGDNGVFHPQNANYVKTTALMVAIAAANGKTAHVTKNFNPLLKYLSKHIPTINKVFGSFSYDLALSEYQTDYRVVNFEESVKASI